MTASTQPGWVHRLDELHLLTPLRILVIFVIAWFLTMAVRAVVRRFVARTILIPGVDRSRADARQKALGGALRGALVGLIWTAAVITVIGEVGINIGAFVATATVVGGAVAFGAQQLVRDVISGLYVIAEDQYGVGDVVDVGHASGTVERITLRSVRLRDGVGAIWHVPHGGVLRVANLSKAPMASLEVEVARSTSLAMLEEEMAALCSAIAADASVAGLLVGKPLAVGVVNCTDDRYVYRLTVATAAGQHEVVRRRWRRLALEMFEAGTLQAPSLAAPVVHVNTMPPLEE